MKKIMILAIAAVALAACAKTHDATPVQQKEIGFGTWAQTLTKARATANDNTAFANGEAFDVFGFKTTAADHIVFDGDDVEATVSGSTVTWDYAPHRFWDPAASSYTFFAVLPAGNLAAEATGHEGDYATTGLFTSNDIVFDDPTAFDNDILVADKEVVAGTGSSAPYTYSNAVELDFNHVASCVDLLVKQDKNLGDAVVKVTALSLLNISNSGHFTVDSYADSAPYVPTVSWDEAATPTTLGTSGEYKVLDSTNAGDDVTVSGKTEYASHTAGTTTGDPAELFTGYVFMPQDLVSQQIKISYTVQVGTEDPNVYTDVLVDICDFMTSDSDNNAAGTAITAWAPKTKYIYTITIGANVIEFTATVKDWASTVSGYHYLLN